MSNIRTVLVEFKGGRTTADLRTAAFEGEGEGSSKDFSEITCWIACDLFHDGLRIPVKIIHVSLSFLLKKKSHNFQFLKSRREVKLK